MRDHRRSAAFEHDEDEQLLDVGDDGNVQIAMATGEAPSVHWRRDSIRKQADVIDDNDDDDESCILEKETRDGTASVTI